MKRKYNKNNKKKLLAFLKMKEKEVKDKKKSKK
jgi:hypothetical protein